MLDHSDAITKNVTQSNTIGLTALASDIDLRGKTVLVTGGAVGIGRALIDGALRFGARKVVAVDIRDDELAKLKQTLGDKVETVHFDMGERDENKVEEFKQQLRKKLGGKLDVVFSNVGVVKLTDIKKNNTLANTPVSEFDSLFKINASSNLVLMQAVGDLLKQSSSPRYIATTSPIVGRADPATAAYATTKAAQEAIVQNISKEMEAVPHFIATAIDPGRVQTFLRRDIYNKEPLHAQPAPEDIAEVFLRAASINANASKLHNKVVICQNTVAGEVEANGKKFKLSGRTAHGYQLSIAQRGMNSLGEKPEVIIPEMDSWNSRQLMGAEPAPALDMNTGLSDTFHAPSGQAAASPAAPFIILHDRDNNLVSEEVTFRAYHKLLADKGIDVPLEELRQKWVGKRYEVALDELDKKYGITVGDESIADARDRIKNAYEDAVILLQRDEKPFKGVIGTLALLQHAGFEQMIVTNNSGRVVREGNKTNGIHRFIADTHVISGDEIAKRYPDKSLDELTGGSIGFKPSADLYQMAMEKKGVSPDHAIAIEDSLSGIKAAKNAGIGTIVVNLYAMRQAASDSEIDAYIEKAKAAGATDVIFSYPELLDIVKNHALAPEESKRRLSDKVVGLGPAAMRAAFAVEKNDGTVPESDSKTKRRSVIQF